MWPKPISNFAIQYLVNREPGSAPVYCETDQP